MGYHVAPQKNKTTASRLNRNKVIKKHSCLLIFNIFEIQIKVKRKISSQRLQISELKKIIGKYVEITVRESSPENQVLAEKPAAGILSAFKNSGKVSFEEQAWKNAVNEKHGNY
jgi:hypothetical protein